MEASHNIQQRSISLNQIELVVCIVGNDGTGKSTICQYNNTKVKPSTFFIERSSKEYPPQFQVLKQQLKELDLLTYTYAFQEKRKAFTPIRQLNIQGRSIDIYWIILDLHPTTILNRLQHRQVVDIYDSKKAIEYYSLVYRQFAWYYGIPLISMNNEKSCQKCLQQIYTVCQAQVYCQIEKMAFKNISLQLINQLNLEKTIRKHLQANVQTLNTIKVLVRKHIESSAIYQFYRQGQGFDSVFKSDQTSQTSKALWVSLCARWLTTNGVFSVGQENPLLIYSDSFSNTSHATGISITTALPYLKIYQEGQSKILLKIHSQNQYVNTYFQDKVIILLKSTIYSHTKQHTGQIANLGKIRALGNMLFLEMIRRNNIKHSYQCISSDNAAIILSELVSTNQLQIVFKKECLGTDKHSYSGIQNFPEIVNPDNNQYSAGVYVRFDWRNPNHFLLSNPNLVLNSDIFYYPIEQFYGKERFFKEFLSNPKVVKEMGDKCITQDMLASYANLQKAKTNALKLYTAFEYYTRKVGLEILDGCFMFDITGQIAWSQINPDCMRVKSIELKEDYDKDIWRYGGSSSKAQICQKWNKFNQLFVDWFSQNRFHQTELIELPQLAYPFQQICRDIIDSNQKGHIFLSAEYRHIYESLTRTKKLKRLIGTIDISQNKPILVKSSKVTQTHSNGNLQQAFEHISLLQELVLVDIDAALGRQQENNRESMAKLIRKAPQRILAVGGGIRSKNVLNECLNLAANNNPQQKIQGKQSHNSTSVHANKVILSSKLQQLVSQLPKETISSQIIAQVSINQKNEVLTHGRTQNTHMTLNQYLSSKIIPLGIENISITFTAQEGHLKGIPRKQLIQIMFGVPKCIKWVIIAGGISTVDDLRFVWGFERCIPQLGSSIWKGKLTVADIWNEMTVFGPDGLLVAIIVLQSGCDDNIHSTHSILGQIYMNRQSLFMCCKTKQLYRYSREHKKVMRKGDSSGNTFQIKSMKLDCDNDSVIMTVCKSKDNTNKEVQFCHLGNRQGCFDNERVGIKEKNQVEDKVEVEKQIENKVVTGKEIKNENDDGREKEMMMDLPTSSSSSKMLSLQQLQEHILLRSQQSNGYSHLMLRNQGLAAMKMKEEVDELILSEQCKTDEAADLLAHLLMYLNAHKVKISDVMAVLQSRKGISATKNNNNNNKKEDEHINKQQQLKLVSTSILSNPNQSSILKVGMVCGKHSSMIDKVIQQLIGIRVIRAASTSNSTPKSISTSTTTPIINGTENHNRSAKIDYQVVNVEKYQQYFGRQTVIQLIGVKSKDMVPVMAKGGVISSCVNYSVMMDNCPVVAEKRGGIPVKGIILALLSRKGADQPDPNKWTPTSKGRIISEYPYSVHRYFTQTKKISQKCFTIIKVNGSTESYLAAQNSGIDYCDAIVQSGKTVKDNNLEIVAILDQNIQATLYVRIS